MSKLPVYTFRDKNFSESFFELVFAVVRLVPYGRVSTYGAIAKYLGTGSSARMVGWAMNASHIVEPPVPAHRIVNRQGLLSGKMHFETPTRMEELLQSEGIEVKDNQVVRFKELFWDPQTEIDKLL
ncbi:MAG: MGMT family protein [Hydrotalea sp.]|nr:MGMT family protein [Hydrotalea sp.]